MSAHHVEGESIVHSPGRAGLVIVGSLRIPDAFSSCRLFAVSCIWFCFNFKQKFIHTSSLQARWDSMGTLRRIMVHDPANAWFNRVALLCTPFPPMMVDLAPAALSLCCGTSGITSVASVSLFTSAPRGCGVQLVSAVLPLLLCGTPGITLECLSARSLPPLWLWCSACVTTILVAFVVAAVIA